MSDFGYTKDSPPPPGGTAWLDAEPVVHGRLWRFGEWLMVPGNLESSMCCVVVGAFAIVTIASWLVNG